MTFDVASYIPPEQYDLMYSWYTPDLEFYVGAARAAGGPVLEVACGTGRVLLPTLEAGADIDGLDVHPGMLEVLRRKAAERGLHPHVVQADMRDFTMRRRYRLATIPFRAFMHLMTTVDQVRALQRIRAHLEPGGRLIFNLFFPSFDAITSPRLDLHDREFTDAATGHHVLLRTTRHENDRVGQVMRSERTMDVLDAGGRPLATYPHAFELRWTWRYEMELLLARAGFARWDVRGGFDGRPLERDTDEMVWTAWQEGA